MLARVERIQIFEAVLVQPAHGGLEPRVEHDAIIETKEVADAVAPAEFFFVRAGGHEVHRARQIDARSFEMIVRFHVGNLNARTEKIQRHR